MSSSFCWYHSLFWILNSWIYQPNLHVALQGSLVLPAVFRVCFKMPRKPKKELTAFQKGQIFALSQEGISNREIGRRLDIDESTVRSNLKKMKLTGSMDNKPRSGRPSVMISSRTEFGLICKRSPFKPATQLRQDLISSTENAPSISVVCLYELSVTPACF